MRQFPQVRSDVTVPFRSTTFPATHVVHGAQVSLFCWVVNLPPVQFVQMRSEVVVPAASTCFPATQFVHGVQAVWPGCEVYPLTGVHDEQMRLVIGVGAVVWYAPEEQIVCGAHDAAL